MHFEEFSLGSSFIHRLDPRIKIISALLFSSVVAVVDRFPVMAAALAVSGAMLLPARLHLDRVGRRLLLVNTFVLFIWLVVPFTYHGQTLFQIGPLSASREGLRLSLAITLKSNTIVLAVIALLATSPVFTLVHALRHLYVPDKLVNLFFFTYRYFQVIHGEYLRLRSAMRIRCFQPTTNRHTYRSLAYLLGMLLVRSFDRSERVYQAMLCRGFKGRFWLLTHFTMGRADFAFLGAIIAVTALLAAGQWATPL